jgi:hypothetical protein
MSDTLVWLFNGEFFRADLYDDDLRNAEFSLANVTRYAFSLTKVYISN